MHLLGYHLPRHGFLIRTQFRRGCAESSLKRYQLGLFLTFAELELDRKMDILSYRNRYDFNSLKEIYYPMSFLEQMTWVQEDVEQILNNNTLETMRSAGVERFGEPGYGGSIKRLLEIIKTDPKNKPILREIIKAERELLLFIYDEHTDLTEDYIRNYWKEYFKAYCYVLEQNNRRMSNE